MKKFLEEFKAFALRGNVMDMAIGVIIGGAFSGIVTSLTDNFYQSDPECAYRRSNVYTEGCIRICFILCLISDQFCDHGIYSFLSSEGGKQDHFHRSKKRGRACTNYEGMSVLQK